MTKMRDAETNALPGTFLSPIGRSILLFLMLWQTFFNVSDAGMLHYCLTIQVMFIAMMQWITLYVHAL